MTMKRRKQHCLRKSHKMVIIFFWLRVVSKMIHTRVQSKNNAVIMSHGLFLEGVYKIELDTKTEYEGF
jgi:hypothetical protein